MRSAQIEKNPTHVTLNILEHSITCLLLREVEPSRAMACVGMTQSAYYTAINRMFRRHGFRTRQQFLLWAARSGAFEVVDFPKDGVPLKLINEHSKGHFKRRRFTDSEVLKWRTEYRTSNMTTRDLYAYYGIDVPYFTFKTIVLGRGYKNAHPHAVKKSDHNATRGQ